MPLSKPVQAVLETTQAKVKALEKDNERLLHKVFDLDTLQVDTEKKLSDVEMKLTDMKMKLSDKDKLAKAMIEKYEDCEKESVAKTVELRKHGKYTSTKWYRIWRFFDYLIITLVDHVK